MITMGSPRGEFIDQRSKSPAGFSQPADGLRHAVKFFHRVQNLPINDSDTVRSRLEDFNNN